MCVKNTKQLARPVDEKIVKLLKSGADQNRGVKLFIDTYGRSLYAFIMTYTHQGADSDDIFQNVLIKIVGKSATFRGRSGLKTWVWAIARNECIDFLRKRGRENQRQAEFTDKLTGGLKEEPFFEGDEILAKLHAAVQRLPEVQKSVFILRYFQELSYREIAAITKKSEGSMKASYFHAARKVSEIMTEVE